MNQKTAKLINRKAEEILNFYIYGNKDRKQKIDKKRTLEAIKRRLKKEWNDTPRKERNKLRK